MPKFGEEVEKRICSQVVDTEYSIAKANQEEAMAEFESIVDMLDSKRTDKEYEWMSDIRVPEFASHVLTQASMDVSTYFRTRDYVEVYVEDQSDEAMASAEAAKECLNRTLNQRHLNYYLKFVRSRMLNQLFGRCYAECWWSQKVTTEVYAYKEIPVELDEDIYGNPITDRSVQVPKIEFQQEPMEQEVALLDRFEFDVVDPRNVFTDNSYCYSFQDKPFVIIRSEKSMEDLKNEAERCGYFNLDLLQEAKTDSDTETRRETYNAESSSIRPVDKKQQWFDVLKRYGPMWVIVKETDPETGLPTVVKPGFDDNGEIKPKAELHECITTVAIASGKSTLIGMQPTPYVDAYNQPYRPVIRGMCYVHPVEDGGFGDGKHGKELQVAIDDTFNISMDRTKLATIPTFQVKKWSLEDNDSLYFEPGHPMQVNEIGDVQEFKIIDNIQGALTQVQILSDKMQQLTSIYPVTMGRLPVAASTTATAVAGAESRSDTRSHFKALTMENTFDSELYWIIMQMTYQFAKPETGFKLMGDKVYDFDAGRDYWFKPVSQSVETEYSKTVKVQKLMQFLQILQPYAPLYANQPGFTKFINDVMLLTARYLGDEPSSVAKTLLNPAKPPVMETSQGTQPEQPMIPGQVPSNQNMMPQSPQEQQMRQGASGGWQ